ncbi:MAG: hypothetical protein JRF52_03460 [Deltaproteobacteria bacterium]|nr:hypothetical protein [Deltaproteobacteria bacterium]
MGEVFKELRADPASEERVSIPDSEILGLPAPQATRQALEIRKDFAESRMNGY